MLGEVIEPTELTVLTPDFLWACAAGHSKANSTSLSSFWLDYLLGISLIQVSFYLSNAQTLRGAYCPLADKDRGANVLAVCCFSLNNH